MNRSEPPPRAPRPDAPPATAVPWADGPAVETTRHAPQPATPHLDAERLAALPPLPRDDDGPVFAEPWQAQAFALAVTLSEQGRFTWKEWTGALADELRTAAARGEPDDGSRYYHHWVAALEPQGGVGRRLPPHAARPAGGAARAVNGLPDDGRSRRLALRVALAADRPL